MGDHQELSEVYVKLGVGEKTLKEVNGKSLSYGASLVKWLSCWPRSHEMMNSRSPLGIKANWVTNHSLLAQLTQQGCSCEENRSCRSIRYVAITWLNIKMSMFASLNWSNIKVPLKKSNNNSPRKPHEILKYWSHFKEHPPFRLINMRHRILLETKVWVWFFFFFFLFRGLPLCGKTMGRGGNRRGSDDYRSIYTLGRGPFQEESGLQ